MGAVEDLAAVMRSGPDSTRPVTGTIVEVLDATHVRVDIGQVAVKAFGSGAVGESVRVLLSRGSADVLAKTGSAWTAPTLAGSWVNYGGDNAPAGYRLNGDTVELRGSVKSGTGTIFTLPAGMRPTAGTASFVVPAGPGAAIVEVRWDGPVRLVSYLASGTNALVCLAGVRVPLA